MNRAPGSAEQPSKNRLTHSRTEANIPADLTPTGL